jgi:hypothetical protein
MRALNASSVKLISNGMHLVPTEPEHLLDFLGRISPENLRELHEFYRLDPTEAIMGLIEDQDVHSVIYEDEVVCLTAVYPDGRMWAMFSQRLNANKLRFVRASRTLIEYYHQTHEHLQCSVWIQNGKTIQWLSHLGFEAVGVNKNDNNDEYVVFVRCASGTESNSPEPPRPVMH